MTSLSFHYVNILPTLCFCLGFLFYIAQNIFFGYLMPGHDEVTTSMYIYEIVIIFLNYWSHFNPAPALQYVYTNPMPRTFNIYTLILHYGFR